MQNKSLISVIVPCYNVGKYVAECLESIIAQSYQNLEIIVINDGSTDNTAEVIKPFLSDNRIKYIHQENKGLSEARNRGLDEMKGEYVCFVDSDDFIHKNFVKILYENLIKYDVDIAICDFVYYDKEGKKSNHHKTDEIDILISDRMQSMNFINKDFRYVVAWNKLYKSSLFNDLRYVPNKIHEDEFIAHYLFWKIDKVVKIKDILYYYRQVSDSIMNSSYTDKKLQNAIEAFNDRIDFYKKNKIGDIKRIYNLKWGIVYYKGFLKFNLDVAKRYIIKYPLEFFTKFPFPVKKKIKLYFKLLFNR